MQRPFLVFSLLLVLPVLVCAQISETNNFPANPTRFSAWASAGIGFSDNQALGFNLNASIIVLNEFFTIQYLNMKTNQTDFNFFKPVDSRYEINATYGIHTAPKHVLAALSGGICYRKEHLNVVVGEKTNDLFGTNPIYEEVEKDGVGITVKGQLLVKTDSFGIGPSLVLSRVKSNTYLSFFLDIAFGGEEE